jgi:hypothetical protein
LSAAKAAPMMFVMNDLRILHLKVEATLDGKPDQVWKNR